MNIAFSETVDTDFCKISSTLQTLNLETFQGIYLIQIASIGIDSANNVYINQINYQDAPLSPKGSEFNKDGGACLNMQGNTIHNGRSIFCKSVSLLKLMHH